YDRFGNLASLTDAGGTETVFQYDELNRPTATLTGFDDLAASLRGGAQPWTIVAGTLVIAAPGATGHGDSIVFQNANGHQSLAVNDQTYSLNGLSFDS